MRLEELKKGAVIRGVLPGQKVSVVDAKWFGDSAVELFYRADDGRTGSELLYRDRGGATSADIRKILKKPIKKGVSVTGNPFEIGSGGRI